MLATRRFTVLGLGALLLPTPAFARKWRLVGSFVEAVLVGAVSGYVAARVAENRASSILTERSWHSADTFHAPTSFHGMEYPTEQIVQLRAGRYEVKSAKRVKTDNGSDLTVLVLKDHINERYIGVAYA